MVMLRLEETTVAIGHVMEVGLLSLTLAPCIQSNPKIVL